MINKHLLNRNFYIILNVKKIPFQKQIVIMQRRDALKNVALLVGAGLVSESMLSLLSCNTSAKKNSGQLVTADQQNTLTELADIIIPATSSPGAKAAGVGPFITMMLGDCYPEDGQKDFVAGLDDFSKSVKEGRLCINKF